MSFTQGLSGLNAASKDLEVVGNNVANVSTVGFKGSRAQFADVFAASLGGAGTSQIGIGARLATVAQQFTQGNISVTNNPLDMAVNGPGFFVLNGVNGTGYSRNGQFQVDKNGYIVSSTGQFLQGYPANSSGVISSGGAPANLQISTASILPTQTSNVAVGLNLDSRLIAPSIPFDPNNTASFNSSSSTTTYDSLGNAQINSIYLAKTVANTWDVYATVSRPTPSVQAFTTAYTNGSPTGTVANTVNLVVGQSITGGGFPAGSVITSIPSATTFTSSLAATSTGSAAVTFTEYYLTPSPKPAAGAWTAIGTLAFSTNGTYDSVNSVTPVIASFTPPGASAQTLTYDFTTATQFGAAFGVTKLAQDGNTSGALGGFSTAADGTIVGRYSNGLTKALGQVALATFANNQGLQPLGDNVWAETGVSGLAVVGVPGTGNRGVLQTAAVEDSSVDLTAELVNMITAQRNYQANAQTIKTQDAVLQTLVNLR